MMRDHELATKGGKIGQFDLLAARDDVSLIADQDNIIDSQIKKDDPAVNNVLQYLQATYGTDHLKELSDRELYQLYKRHALSSK